jgi:transcriptional regulator with XRE-family HTH domain
LLTIGDHLKKRRLDLGLSRRQVAGRLGVDQASVGNWENGRATPQARYLPKITAFLG